MLAIASDDRSVTLTPATLLAINTLFTVTVDATVSDPGGNPLGTAFVATFRTASPDNTAPHVESIDPPNNATGVATTIRRLGHVHRGDRPGECHADIPPCR